MKKTLTIFLLLPSMLFFSQIKFEEAYIIDNNNIKSECLIKNKQWNIYPTEIEYKLNENTEIKIGKINDIKEFGIGNDIYKRFEVDVDKSSNNLNDLSEKAEPEFIKEKVFLRLMVDGQIQLYKYSGNQNIKFFYKTKDQETPKQLIFKRFYDPSKDVVISNNQFRKQLFELTGYHTLIDYKESGITKLFEAKNQTKRISDQKDYFHLTVRPGINLSSANVENNISIIDMKTKPHFRIGLEAEYNFSFNKNKWALLLEPEFSTIYKDEKEVNYLSGSDVKQNLNVEYKNLKLSLGVRHYMFLNSKNRIFLNLLYSWNIDAELKVYYTERKDIIDKSLSTANNIAYGIGYSYNDKYFLETRFQKTKIFYEQSKVQTFSIILGYRIF